MMNKPGMKPIFRYLIALAFLMPIAASMGTRVTDVRHARIVVETAGAKEDCRLPAGLQCVWDREDFQGNMKAADLTGQCMHYSIRSASNNGKSGQFTLYLYQEANCGGEAVSRLNAGDSVRSVTAESARFAPKGS